VIRKSIADVVFNIENDSDCIMREYNSISEAFCFSENESLTEHQINIRISNEPLPVFGHQAPLFEAQDSWYVYKDDQFYRIVLHPPGYQEPFWVACVDHNFSNGTVYCGEQLKDSPEDLPVLFNPVTYPLDQILLMHYLARLGGMIIHAAGWRMNDSGWIFAGKSGAGKSTISNLIVEETGATFLSDDRIVVRKIGQDFLMYGTPWPGDAGYALNESVPLKGIFFLSKGSQNDIKRLKPSDAIARLMPVVSILWYDREKVALMMDFCDAMMAGIPMYELTFVPDKEAVDMLLGFVNEH
jgi:hypothetical protein